MIFEVACDDGDHLIDRDFGAFGWAHGKFGLEEAFDIHDRCDRAKTDRGLPELFGGVFRVGGGMLALDDVGGREAARIEYHCAIRIALDLGLALGLRCENDGCE